MDWAESAEAQSTALPKPDLPNPVTEVFSQCCCQANSQLCMEEGKGALFPFLLVLEGLRTSQTNWYFDGTLSVAHPAGSKPQLLELHV